MLSAGGVVPPGHVFTAPEGGELSVAVTASLTTRDPVRFLEVIRDGRVERKVPFAEWSRAGTLGTLRFRESGWFLVRAVADNPKTFRFASSAPYYVEVGAAKRRVSKTSARFFLDWVRERIGRVKLDGARRREVIPPASPRVRRTGSAWPTAACPGSPPRRATRSAGRAPW